MTIYKSVLSKILLCKKRKCNGGYDTSMTREELQKEVKARSFVFDIYRYNFQASSQWSFIHSSNTNVSIE